MWPVFEQLSVSYNFVPDDPSFVILYPTYFYSLTVCSPMLFAAVCCCYCKFKVDKTHFSLISPLAMCSNLTTHCGYFEMSFRNAVTPAEISQLLNILTPAAVISLSTTHTKRRK